MTIESEIIVVSGLPRSGTSLMMQMLAAGGIEIVTDHQRAADADNPLGYCEFEKVKQIKHDATWLSGIRGKAVKMVSQLLYDLPAAESYRIVFMERDLEEVLASQEKMLARLQKPAAPRDQIRRAFALHLEGLRAWLRQQPNMAVLNVNYNELLESPQPLAERVNEFLGREGEVARMIAAIDPSLYRNKRIRANPEAPPTP